MPIELLGGKRIALGLEWHILPGLKTVVKEAAAIARENSLKFGAVVVSEDGSAVGLCDNNKEKGLVPGAALLALHAPESDFVFMERLDDGAFWLCVIKDGIPVRGFDVVGTEAVVMEKLTDIMAYGLLPVYGATLPHGAPPAKENYDFATLVGGGKNTVKIKQLYGISPGLMLGVVGLAGIAGLLLFYMQYKEKVDAQLAQSMMMASAQEIAQKKAAESAKQAASFKQEIQQQALEIVSAPDIAAQSDLWLGVLKNMPFFADGWKLTGLHCENVLCTMDWERESGVSSRLTEIIHAAAPDAQISFVDANKASIAMVVKEATKRSSDLPSVPAAATLLSGVIDPLQQLKDFGINFELKDSVQITPKGQSVTTAKVANMDGSLSPLVQATQAMPYKSGLWSLHSDEYGMLGVVPDKLSKINGFAIKKLVIKDIGNQPVWEMEGVYVVQ